MSNLILPRLLFKHQHSIIFSSQRYQRGPFGPPKRTYEDRNRETLNLYKDRRLELASPKKNRPGQWNIPELPPNPIIKTKERKLLSMKESASPYQRYSDEPIKDSQYQSTFYDPKFNPHLPEERHRVNPDEEPFNAIYADSKSETANEYTKVRNITTPELWKYVERLARIKMAPEIKKRRANEPIQPLPSGLVPPPENPPDLPYFVPRTRNYLLPVYYKLHSDPEQCFTIVKQVTGDLWQLEADLRAHLESLNDSKRRILTSVHETDERVLFKGKYLHQVVDWLHEKGF